MICKCIKQSDWFKIDDSFSDDNSNGGEISYLINEIHDLEKSKWLNEDTFIVKHSNGQIITFDEKLFKNHFEIINK